MEKQIYENYAQIVGFGCDNESWTYWNTDPAYNIMYLASVQQHFNNKLKDRGCVTLKEVYEELKLEPRPNLDCYGWKYNSVTGDGYIDLGLYTDINKDFINQTRNAALLIFNFEKLN